MSVFHTSVLLLIMNFVITLSWLSCGSRRQYSSASAADYFDNVMMKFIGNIECGLLLGSGLMDYLRNSGTELTMYFPDECNPRTKSANGMSSPGTERFSFF